MGIFDGLRRTREGSKSRSGLPQKPIEITVADGDLRRAEALLAQFNEAAGRDDGPAVLAAGGAIARAGGYAGLEDLFRRTAQNRNEMDRPWLWLAAVLRRAADTDEVKIVALAYMFLEVWSGQVAPRMMPADIDEFGLGGPPKEVQAEFATVALNCLVQHDPEQVISSSPTITLHIADVAKAASVRSITLDSKGVAIDGTVLDAARRIIG
jgi:hypothetical protein